MKLLFLLAAPFTLGEECLKCGDLKTNAYSGSLSTTASGRTCQEWSEDSPHSHGYHDMDANYCRNPDGEDGGPWCYTTDPARRWEYCSVPTCASPGATAEIGCVEEEDALGSNYTGKQTTTRSGRTCQCWSSDSPHSHGYNDQQDNFCRNPSGSAGGPWCYTTDPAQRWEYCGVPTCAADPSAPTCVKWGKGKGGDYRGQVSVTRTGATCDTWADADLGNWAHGDMGRWRWTHNFCRNPDDSARGPWCYVPGTNDPYYIGAQGRDYCTIPYCEGEDKGLENPDLYYCEIEPDHTMCFPPGPAEACKKSDIGGLSAEEKDDLLTMHNDRRRRIAKGKVEGQPPAANMLEMVWDGELEMIAQRWTDQCIWGHDTGSRRRLDGTYCGQNGASGYSPPSASVQGWFSEVENMEKDCVPSSYNGSLSTTVSGRTCQQWADNSPHKHDWKQLESNFCRNPNNEEGGPWCYTTDPDTRWEYCAVPTCEDPAEDCAPACEDCKPVKARTCDVDRFGSGVSSGTIGHYTQVVWAESGKVGCGRRGSTTFCNYEGGNMSGSSIYKRGPACSACPEGTTCNDGLCKVTKA